MANYRLTRKADNDLAIYYEYGILNFGPHQAQKYLLGLHERFQHLVDTPELERSAEEFFPGLKRQIYREHVIFYLIGDDDEALIVRVLRKEMDFRRHL